MPGQSSPDEAQSALLSKESHQRYAEWAKSKQDETKELQSSVRALRESSVAYADVEKQIRSLGYSGGQLSKIMSSYHRSLKEIMDMPLSQWTSEWKNNLMSLGQAALPVLTLGALAKVFLTLDAAGAQANRTITGMGIQAGELGKSLRGGYGSAGGLTSRTGSSEQEKAYQSATLNLIRLGYSSDEASQVMLKMSQSLPSELVTKTAPKFAEAAGVLSKRFDIDVGTSTELLTSAFRRGMTSVDGLNNLFKSLESTVKSSHLSQAEYLKTTNALWISTRGYGGTLEGARRSVLQFGSAIDRGINSQEEMTNSFMRGQGMKSASIATLGTLGQGMSGYGTIFGSAKTPEQMIGSFEQWRLSKSYDPAVLEKLQQSVLRDQANRMTTAGMSPSDVAGRLALVREQLGPALSYDMGAAEMERRSRTLTGGAYIPGAEVPGVMGRRGTTGAAIGALDKVISTFGKEAETAAQRGMGLPKVLKQVGDAFSIFFQHPSGKALDTINTLTGVNKRGPSLFEQMTGVNAQSPVTLNLTVHAEEIAEKVKDVIKREWAKFESSFHHEVSMLQTKSRGGR